ncbi:hypothetical protein C8J56DRAFT_1051944 [Mycena floridula]|nr:hypothetical protein C8J56DRAFT_1051944 [Mycena floridula]
MNQHLSSLKGLVLRTPSCDKGEMGQFCDWCHQPSWLLRGTSFPLLLVIFSTLASDHPLFRLHEIRPFRHISCSEYALWKVLNEPGCFPRPWSCVVQAAMIAKWVDSATGVVNVSPWPLHIASFPLILVIFLTLGSQHPLFRLREIRSFRPISWSEYALWKVLNEHVCRQKDWPRVAQAAMIAKWLKFATGVVNLLRMASFPLILVIFPTLGSDRPLLCQHEMRLFQRSAGSEYLPWMVLMNRAIAEGLSGPW